MPKARTKAEISHKFGTSFVQLPSGVTLGAHARRNPGIRGHVASSVPRHPGWSNPTPRLRAALDHHDSTGARFGTATPTPDSAVEKFMSVPTQGDYRALFRRQGLH